MKVLVCAFAQCTSAFGADPQLELDELNIESRVSTRQGGFLKISGLPSKLRIRRPKKIGTGDFPAVTPSSPAPPP